MSLAKVQSAHGQNAGSTATATATLGSTPTIGNLMISCCETGSSQTLTVPTGWTQIDSIADSGDRLSFAYRVVQSGDGAAVTWTASGAADFVSVCVIEVSGQAAASFINQHNTAFNAGSQTTLATNNMTPSVLNCMAIAAFGHDHGGRADAYSTGWTRQELATPAFQACSLGTRDALTSDTTTGINVTCTLSSADHPFLATQILIAPSALTSVTKTLTASYNVIKQIPKTVSTTYTVKQPITKTVSTNYIVRKTIVKTVTSTYNVIQRIAKILSISYNIASNPVNTVAPSITGSPISGQLLTANHGTWTNSPTSYTYQWQVEDSPGSGTYSDIVGETGSTLQL